MTITRAKPCKDCVTEGITRPDDPVKQWRATPHPGPRCRTHHLRRRQATRLAAHRRTTEGNFTLGVGGYDKLLAVQGGSCAGCGRTPGPRAKRLAVDHDHSCCPGKASCGRCVRGLLCHRCNDVLAHLRDDPEKLIRLARYLREWPSLGADL